MDEKNNANKNHLLLTQTQSFSKYELQRKRMDTKIIVISATALEKIIKNGNKNDNRNGMLESEFLNVIFLIKVFIYFQGFFLHLFQSEFFSFFYFWFIN